MAGEIPQPLIVKWPEGEMHFEHFDTYLYHIQQALWFWLPDLVPSIDRLKAGLGVASDVLHTDVRELPARLTAEWKELPSEKLAAALLPGSAPDEPSAETMAAIYDRDREVAKAKGKASVEHVMENPQGQVERFLKACFTEGPIDPGACLARVGKALAFQSAVGLVAHGTSALLSTQFMGSGLANTSGIGAAIAEFAGFGPATSGVQSPFYDAYLRQPWTYNCNDIFRPFIPGPRDLLRMWLKARADPEYSPLKARTDVAGNLAKHGFSDRWIGAMLADAAEEPNLRGLQTMMETLSPRDPTPWLRKKLLLLGYDEPDTDRLVEGLLSRQRSYYVRDRISNALERLKLGLDTTDNFSRMVDALKVPFPVRGVLYELADEEADLALKKRELEAIKLAYSRDQISDADLDYELEALGFEYVPRAVMVQIEKLKRYHKVWRKTPPEKARDALAIYRAAFKAGLMTEPDYLGALALAGLEADAILLAFNLDALERDKALAGDLRQYELPAWRDKAVQGTITLEAYKARLVGLRFPGRYLAAECALVAYLAERQREQRVQSRQVPTMERAYILGLVDSWALERTYEEAAWSAAEIARRRTLVDELRDRERDRRDKYGPEPDEEGMTKAEKQALAEWKYVNGEITADQLRAILEALGVLPDAVERRLAALAPLRG